MTWAAQGLHGEPLADYWIAAAGAGGDRVLLVGRGPSGRDILDQHVAAFEKALTHAGEITAAVARKRDERCAR